MYICDTMQNSATSETQSKAKHAPSCPCGTAVMY